MSFNKTFYAIFLIAFIVACSPVEEQDANLVPLEDEAIEEAPEIIEEEIIPTIQAHPPKWSTNGLDFAFGDYVFVAIDEMGMDFEHKSHIYTKTDSALYNLDLGEHINDVTIRVSTPLVDGYTKFEVFQRSVLHFSISNEGPHCDLLEVEPYYSDWKALKVNELNASFQTLDRDAIIIPEVSLSPERFKEQVLEHCGEHYAVLLESENNSNPNTHLGTSGYELKIEATKKDGSVQTRYIYFSSPMGC